VHSCTPLFAGFRRPWHFGVLWNQDGRLAGPLLAALARDGEVCVGDNQPYSGRDGHGYTLPTHAEARGLPHATIEIRQDLIGAAAGIERWARRLATRWRRRDRADRMAPGTNRVSTEPSFTIGIEEEYHLVDRATRDLAAIRRPA